MTYETDQTAEAQSEDQSSLAEAHPEHEETETTPKAKRHARHYKEQRTEKHKESYVERHPGVSDAEYSAEHVGQVHSERHYSEGWATTKTDGDHEAHHDASQHGHGVADEAPHHQDKKTHNPLTDEQLQVLYRLLDANAEWVGWYAERCTKGRPAEEAKDLAGTVWVAACYTLSRKASKDLPGPDEDRRNHWLRKLAFNVAKQYWRRLYRNDSKEEAHKGREDNAAEHNEHDADDVPGMYDLEFAVRDTDLTDHDLEDRVANRLDARDELMKAWPHLTERYKAALYRECPEAVEEAFPDEASELASRSKMLKSPRKALSDARKRGKQLLGCGEAHP